MKFYLAFTNFYHTLLIFSSSGTRFHQIPPILFLVALPCPMHLSRAQSVAMVGTHGKLFGVQLNDGYGRLGAEDGLMFGSVNPRMALEFVLWLQRTRYAGHVYFDTFPRNEDPVREAEYNIRQFKALWERARGLSAAGLEGYWARHDAIGVLELLESGPAL